ncbi:MAG: WbuC family cupin fold metalloprotein [Candidatus Omnitrophota bacterium]
MIKITKDLVNEISINAKLSKRRRCNYNFHQDYADLMNRMLNAVEPGAYFPPHKHVNPDKREIFVILRGRVLVAEFDDKGSITEHVILDPQYGNFGVEIQPDTWHFIVPLKKGSLLYEIKDGPYDPLTDKTFATWAPGEKDEYAWQFVRGVLEKLNIRID